MPTRDKLVPRWYPASLTSESCGLPETMDGVAVKRTLTDLTLRKLAPQPGRRIELWDARLPGFGVRISETGIKSFVVMYRANGIKRRMTLGRWPVLTLGDARAMAVTALNKVALGFDPQVQARQLKIAQCSYSFPEVSRAFVELHCDRHNRPVTKRDTQRILKNRFVGPWAHRDIREITKTDVLQILDGIVAAGTPSAANHALAAIRKLFNWCVERGLVDHNPCTGISKPARDNSRERVLRDEELLAIWKASHLVGYPFGVIIQLLILTGQRRSEVANMRWPGIDLKQRLWSLHQDLTKSNRPHHVPLSPLVVATLHSVAQLDIEYVFPSRAETRGAFANFSQGKKRVDVLSGVTDWTLHDLRRTFSTIHARVGTAPHITERILNHQVGTLTPIAKIYNRYSYLVEMRETMLIYEQELRRIFSLEGT